MWMYLRVQDPSIPASYNETILNSDEITQDLNFDSSDTEGRLGP